MVRYVLLYQLIATEAKADTLQATVWFIFILDDNYCIFIQIALTLARREVIPNKLALATSHYLNNDDPAYTQFWPQYVFVELCKRTTIIQPSKHCNP